MVTLVKNIKSGKVHAVEKNGFCGPNQEIVRCMHAGYYDNRNVVDIGYNWLRVTATSIQDLRNQITCSHCRRIVHGEAMKRRKKRILENKHNHPRMVGGFPK